jgi:hypothetical protein
VECRGVAPNIPPQFSSPIITTLTAVGVVGTTTYGYKVTALNGNGETLASVEKTITTGNATLSATNFNALFWTGVPGQRRTTCTDGPPAPSNSWRTFPPQLQRALLTRRPFHRASPTRAGRSHQFHLREPARWRATRLTIRPTWPSSGSRRRQRRGRAMMWTWVADGARPGHADLGSLLQHAQCI